MDAINDSSNNAPKRIFCYGDSLTAGTSPPFGLYPYGPHLEGELNKMSSSSTTTTTSSSSSPTSVVRWRGLPGWTASRMTEYLDDADAGLRAVINGIRDPPVSLVIILAGTNDVGLWTSSISRKDESIDVSAAVEPILSLHRAVLACHGKNEDGRTSIIRTLAVGIPGSEWQKMNSAALSLCTEMNESLRKFASSHNEVSYVDFPFPYHRGDSKWNDDGLHLSPEGYQALGKELAPHVREILQSMD